MHLSKGSNPELQMIETRNLFKTKSLEKNYYMTGQTQNSTKMQIILKSLLSYGKKL